MSERVEDNPEFLRCKGFGRSPAEPLVRSPSVVRWVSAGLLSLLPFGPANCKPQDTSGYCQQQCEKTCWREGNEICVAMNDPDYGCSSDSCAPCALDNAVAICDNRGQCAIGGCESDFVDCDGRADSGCEVNYAQDPEHCGSCTSVCPSDDPHTTYVCSNGLCVVSECRDGYANCNLLDADGCESETPPGTECAPLTQSSGKCE